MTYPSDSYFDIETLVNVSQPARLLFLGNSSSAFLNDYIEQKNLIGQACDVTHIRSCNYSQFMQLESRFDIAIALDWFEHIDKTQGQRTLSRLRDVLSSQYCICLPLEQGPSDWQLNELFSFALSNVAFYQNSDTQQIKYGLFKYNIDDYKKAPDWLNADNWANPQNWGKYRW